MSGEGTRWFLLGMASMLPALGIALYGLHVLDPWRVSSEEGCTAACSEHHTYSWPCEACS